MVGGLFRNMSHNLDFLVRRPRAAAAAGRGARPQARKGCHTASSMHSFIDFRPAYPFWILTVLLTDCSAPTCSSMTMSCIAATSTRSGRKRQRHRHRTCFSGFTIIFPFSQSVHQGQKMRFLSVHLHLSRQDHLPHRRNHGEAVPALQTNMYQPVCIALNTYRFWMARFQPAAQRPAPCLQHWLLLCQAPRRRVQPVSYQ